MKKSLILTMLLAFVINAVGLEIPKGTFYFDNSLTKYEQVKFVYGSYAENKTWVLSMTDIGNDRWEITIPERVENMYRYTFANTTLPDGKIENTFPNVKEEISNKRNEYRTATTDAAIIVGATYTPTSGDNWAQGGWKVAMSGDGYSGTLPVMHINTEGGQAIVSKEDYINATYYLDALGLDGYQSFGTEEEQLPLEIRGRGNYTWRDFDKKPYRIKLGAKAELLGMKKSKHFALLAHADDNLGFYRNTMGLKLSELIGMAYTPTQHPVEVVLNGDYIGLYFLTETVRVDEDRVNIVEQADEATDAVEITGGWLVEIDNYDEEEQVKITEGNGVTMRFTYKTPELLSNAQRTYLTNQMTAIDNAIYTADKSSTEWEKLVDVDALVRFYIVQEVMQNAESFHGSCYLYKDQGEDKKWMFGPVWDFGNSFHGAYDRFLYIDSPFGNHWIEEWAKFPRFQDHVKSVWANFYSTELPKLEEFMNDFATQISAAAVCDYARWPQYGNYDINAKRKEMKGKLDDRILWLQNNWKSNTSVAEINSDCNIRILGNKIEIRGKDKIEKATLYDINGWIVSEVVTNTEAITLTAPKGLSILSVRLADGSLQHSKVVVK